MSVFQVSFQKQTLTWSIAVKPRTAGKRLWASSRAIETSYALPSSSSSWAEAVGTGVVIQVKRLWGPSSRDAKPAWKRVHIMILLHHINQDGLTTLSSVLLLYGSILQPKQAVNCRQITVHGYQIHPTWILHPYESQVPSQGAFSGTTPLLTYSQPSDSSKQGGWWMHPKTFPLRAVHYSSQTDPDSPASHLPDGAVKFSFPQ